MKGAKYIWKSQVLSATPFCLLLKQKGMHDGNKELQTLM